MNYLKRNIMAFKNMFKDNNDINEKSVIGFLSFSIMVLFAVVDLVTGYLGKDLVINEFIYDSFTLMTLGCFGIAGLEKISVKKNKIKYEKISTTTFMCNPFYGLCTKQLV